MDPQLAVWVGAIIMGLIAAVGFLGRYILQQAEKRIESAEGATVAMTVDRDYWRDRYENVRPVAEVAITKLEKAKGQ